MIAISIVSIVIAIVAIFFSGLSSYQLNQALLKISQVSDLNSKLEEKTSHLEKTISEINSAMPSVLLTMNDVKGEVKELIDDYTNVREIVQDHDQFLRTGKQPDKKDKIEETVH